MIRTRPLEVWKGPQSRWDGKTGWVWKCCICPIESDPVATQPVAYDAAIKHLNEKHLGGGEQK